MEQIIMQTPTTRKKWLTNEEAAEHLRIAVPTLYTKRKNEDFPKPSYRLGRDLPRWDVDQLDAFMNPDANI